MRVILGIWGGANYEGIPELFGMCLGCFRMFWRSWGCLTNLTRASGRQRNYGYLCSAWQQVVQRQLQYLSATTVGLSKLSLVEAHPRESKGLRNQQKAQARGEDSWRGLWLLSGVCRVSGIFEEGLGSFRSLQGCVCGVC